MSTIYVRYPIIFSLYRVGKLSIQYAGNDLCSLVCLAESASIFHDRPGEFCDGTKCWDDAAADVKTQKICVTGKCLVNYFAFS